MITLLNARRNFATNSSSTHSVILAGTGSGHPSGDEFGWDYFLQSTKEQKTSYMAAQLFSALTREIGESAAIAVVKGLFGRTVDPDYTSVDHQSQITCPVDSYGNPVVDFFEELSKALIEDDTVHISGGNDNDDRGREGDPHPRWDFLHHIQDRSSSLVARQNEDGIWTIFNKETGLKLHLKFGPSDAIEQKNYRPAAPELIDIKITDFCPFGCSWCYQDSTVAGKHANYKTISDMYWECQRSGVFEVALGGGEPTLHPNFLDIIKGFKEFGVTPNFTTKNKNWYKKVDFVQTVLDNCGGWAHSVTNDYEVKEIVTLHQAMWALYDKPYPQPKLSFQYIPDAYDLSNFKAVLDAVPPYLTLTLLGYKEVGRGKTRPYTHHDWLDLIKKMEYRPTIAIDTQMAKQYKDQLDKHKISSKMYYTQEGRFSMYIDAVEKKYAKSSYEPDEQYTTYARLDDCFSAFSEWKNDNT